jgi:hypothetical protein
VLNIIYASAIICQVNDTKFTGIITHNLQLLLTFLKKCLHTPFIIDRFFFSDNANSSDDTEISEVKKKRNGKDVERSDRGLN